MTAAEKYAEIGGRENAPLCKCHAMPMGWKRNPPSRAGGYWRCRKQHAMEEHHRYSTDPMYRESRLRYERERLVSDSKHRERRRVYLRERYWNLSGFQYNKELLRKRRSQAVRRMFDRNQRRIVGEVSAQGLE